VPDPNTIPHAVIRSSRRFADLPAIVSNDGDMNYAALEPAIVEATRAFMAAGIERGDRVAIWAPNMPRWIIAALGLQAAGAALVPLNTRYKGREAAYILRASGAKLLLCVSDFLGARYADMIAEQDIPSLERVIRLDEDWDAFLAGGAAVSEDAARARLAGLTGDDVSDILFTSGTTGNPKGVITTHAQNVDIYLAYSTTMGWRAGDRLMAINPFFHSFGYKAGWFCALLHGAAILPQLSFDPEKVLATIAAEKVTLLPGPPTIYQSLLDRDWQAHDLSSLRLAVTGAAMVPVQLIRDMRDKLGFDIVLTAYGLTESSGVVSMCAPDDDIETIANTAGRAVAGVEVRLVDEAGEAVPSGQPGELLVRGANVMKAYLDDPVATAAAIDADGWLKTGDIAVQDDRGNIRITDRSKDIFITGGFNVYPAEVEQALITHPDIAEAAVVGMADERMGEVGHAFVVLRAGSTLDATALTGWCRETMANFKVPRLFHFVDVLPRNASGKVEKFKLRDGG
jgi:acyl-CoA synthetase (AMP-forming)/AMP-acid ligase II